MAAITASRTVLVCVVAGFFEAGDGGADFSFVAPRTVAGLAGAKMRYPAVKATAAIATSRPHCDTKKPLAYTAPHRLPQGASRFNKEEPLG
jgi:hypothetical protein